MLTRHIIAVPILLAFAPAPLLAQDEDEWQEEIVLYHPPRDGYITVLANGTREALSWNGQRVTVFDQAEIEAVQGPDLTRLLERAPGVTWSRNGGAGSFTALRLRGSEADQVLVLVDGVRLADPAAPGAGFDLGTLAQGTLAKVELQRSANSTLWGSQAMGGVLAVTSDVTADPRASLELGTHRSAYATLAASGTMGPLDLGLAAGWQRSNGFSAAAGGTEADGHRQLDLSARLDAPLAANVEAFAQMRLADARTDTDGFPAPDYLLADTAEYQNTRQLSGALGLDGYWGRLQLHAALSQAATDRANYDPAFGPAPGYTASGLGQRAELRGTWGRVTDDWQVHFGSEYEWQSFSSLFDARSQTGLLGAFAQADYDRDDLHLALGLRRDEHRQFGGAWSLGADAAWHVAQDLRLTASYGEGFKAPSLFQLFSDYGNAALRPERARSYDVGLTWERGGSLLALTAFRRDTLDQIVFVSCFMDPSALCANRPGGTYDNRARTRAMGIEVEGTLELADGLDIQAAYALIDTADRTPGAATYGHPLPRRPRHTATLSAGWQPDERVMLAADLRLVSHAFDDAMGTVRLGGYGVVTLRGSFDVSNRIQLSARIENAGNADYQTAAGYAQGGRAGWVGARVRL